MTFKKVAVGLLGLVMLAAVGVWLATPVQAHKSELITKTIEITMNEFSFVVKGGMPALKPGEVVRFKVKNEGKVRHDLHLGKDADTKNELYKNNPFEPFDMLELDAGASADLTLTIPDKVGDWEMGCFQAQGGHYQAGQKLAFKIAK
jgi:uncharacterized cupredoxin-like copper-binding protein